MTKIIIDIETVGVEFESLDEMSQDYMLKFAETDQAKQEAMEQLSFYPLTGQVVAIGLLNPDTNKGAVYFQCQEEKIETFTENDIKFVADNEAGILKKFWEVIKNYNQFITFNGRGFDAPFLIIRSAVHKIKPTAVIMPNRYNNSHLDLLDQLAFYGSVRRRFSLHLWCQTFGIKSPKAEGITGHEVKDLFANKRYVDIAKYCVGDLHATKALYEYWDNYIRLAVA